MSKGGVLIISGPSGSGKDTLLVRLFERCPELYFSISSITRPMREGEKEGEKYHFISREAFDEMIAGNELLEHNTFIGNKYGTPKAPVLAAMERGRDTVIEVDVNGAAQIRERLSEAVSIFIMPPSFDELKRRLSGRGTDSAEAVDMRLDSALSEIRRAGEYDYIVVNDDIDEAVNKIVTIIEAERQKTARCTDLINKVLGK